MENKKEKIDYWMRFDNLSQEEAEKRWDEYQRILAFEDSLTRRQAMNLAKKIKPVRRVNIINGRLVGNNFYGLAGNEGSKLYWISSEPICNMSFTFKSDFVEEAVGLVKLAEITSYHNCNYHGSVVPSVLEVLTQIPKDIKGKVTAFEVYIPSENVNDIYHQAFNLHVLKTVFYSGQVPESILAQKLKW